MTVGGALILYAAVVGFAGPVCFRRATWPLRADGELVAAGSGAYWTAVTYLTTVLSVSVICALTAVLVYRLGLHFSGDNLRALALAFTLAAAIPVQHLLLIGPDLNGSRVLYLPSIGFAGRFAPASDAIVGSMSTHCTTA